MLVGGCMKPISIFDRIGLQKQIDLQRSSGWDLQTDFQWSKGVDLERSFAPLDSDNMAFPGASTEQAVALSQLMGLMVNETISEMECSLPRMKYHGWEKLLAQFPANPELHELGEIFFAEEEKHAKSFQKFLEIFCHQINVSPEELKSLLPSGKNSLFQAALLWNAEQGGAAFWWTVAAVEETSIQAYRAIVQKKNETDPLYFELHKRHAEEESRHDSYAFMMLDVYQRLPKSLKQRAFLKTDLLLSQLLPGPWVLTELAKIFSVKKLAHRSPFFRVLADTLPLFENMPKATLIKNFWTKTPYVSWLINPAFRKKGGQGWALPQGSRKPLHGI